MGSAVVRAVIRTKNQQRPKLQPGDKPVIKTGSSDTLTSSDPLKSQGEQMKNPLTHSVAHTNTLELMDEI